MKTPTVQRWFKSSHSGGSGTECVECGHAGSRALVRDSKQANGPIMTVHVRAWRAFIEGLSRRRFPS